MWRVPPPLPGQILMYMKEAFFPSYKKIISNPPPPPTLMHTHKTFCIALAVYPRTAIIVSLLLLGLDKNKSQIDCLTFNDGGVYCPFDDQFS